MQTYRETFINASEGRMIGDHTESVEDTVFEDMSPGDIYRWLVREYGRCIGKVYNEGDGTVKHVGWTFLRKDRYEDTGDTYLREVWVTFQDWNETIQLTQHHDFGGATVMDLSTLTERELYNLAWNINEELVERARKQLVREALVGRYEIARPTAKQAFSVKVHTCSKCGAACEHLSRNDMCPTCVAEWVAA